MVTAIVGANWGDEGKGKITDKFAGSADIVVRFQGGNNAGHTIVCPYGKFALHLLPSGVFNPHVTNVLGPGVALNVQALISEYDAIIARGVPAPRLIVSDRTQLLMPYHVLFDTLEEERLADRQFGSTKSGIAPFYSDKYAKIGFQVCEVMGDPEKLRDKLTRVIEVKNVLMKHLYHKDEINADELFETLMSWKQWLKPFVANTAEFFQSALCEDKNILLEGQLGALRDVDHGIYPFTTSSSPLAGYGSIGAGLPPHKISRVVTVAKAYSSAVGAGPFVAELFGEEGDLLRRNGADGGEFGATTGRPRRVGWFDAVATRYGCRTQGATEVVLTVVDALGYLDEIPICVAYDLGDHTTTSFLNTEQLYRAKPVLETMPGWKCDIRGIRSYQNLPEACRDYIEHLEALIGVPVRMVSIGPGRDELLEKP